MTYVLYFVLLGSALLFLSVSHPVSLGLILIFHTLLISAVTGLTGGNFWFSYILFLIFLGGVLVLFIYMTSLASNEKFEIGWGSLMVGGMFAALMILGMVFYFLPSSPHNDLGSWVPTTQMFKGLGELTMKLYSISCFKVTVLLIVYLLYALLVCADIVGKYTGALRNFN